MQLPLELFTSLFRIGYVSVQTKQEKSWSNFHGRFSSVIVFYFEQPLVSRFIYRKKASIFDMQDGRVMLKNLLNIQQKHV